jgi:Ca2+/Na+ antiporter
MVAMYFYRNQLAYYLEDIYHSEQAAEAVLATESSGVGGRFIGMLMILVLAMWLRPLTTKDMVYSKVFSIMVLAAIIQLMSVFSNTYTRLANYFYQFIVLFVPMFLRPITKKNELLYRRGNALLQNNEFRLALSVGITVFSIWFFYTQVSSINSNTILLFFWEKNGHLLY